MRAISVAQAVRADDPIATTTPAPCALQIAPEGLVAIVVTILRNGEMEKHVVRQVGRCLDRAPRVSATVP